MSALVSKFSKASLFMPEERSIEFMNYHINSRALMLYSSFYHLARESGIRPLLSISREQILTLYLFFYHPSRKNSAWTPKSVSKAFISYFSGANLYALCLDHLSRGGRSYIPKSALIINFKGANLNAQLMSLSFILREQITYCLDN